MVALVLAILITLLPKHQVSNECLAFSALPVPLVLPEFEVRVPVYEGWLPVVLAYLNAGGVELEADLRAAMTSAYNDPNALVDVQALDVTGDNEPDWVVQLAIYGGGGVDNFIEGAVLVFQCQAGQYVGYQVAAMTGYRGGEFTGSPTGLDRLVDMNGNGLPEFLFSSIYNFATHAYYDRFYDIYEWDGTGFARLTPIYEDPYLGTYSAVAAFEPVHSLEDTNGDGTLELVLVTPQFRHHNYEEWSRLNRGDKYIWGWDEAGYSLLCSQKATPAEYRIQAIEDAEDAIACGDYARALAAYQQVIEDDNLLTWTAADNLCPGCDPVYNEGDLAARAEVVEELGTPVPDPQERPRLSAFAHWGRMLVYVAMGEVEAAEGEYALLQASEFPQFVALAGYFWSIYEPEMDITVLCQQVNEYAIEQSLSHPIDGYAFAGLPYIILDYYAPVCPWTKPT